MAPKNRVYKGESSTSSSTFDLSKFFSQEVSKRYIKPMSLKFIREKGFVKPNGKLRRKIFLKGWTDLCKHLEATVAPIGATIKACKEEKFGLELQVSKVLIRI